MHHLSIKRKREILTEIVGMLRKIDCVMIRVDDIQAAADYYANVFGLLPQWSAEDLVNDVKSEQVLTSRVSICPQS